MPDSRDDVNVPGRRRGMRRAGDTVSLAAGTSPMRGRAAWRRTLAVREGFLAGRDHRRAAATASAPAVHPRCARQAGQRRMAGECPPASPGGGHGPDALVVLRHHRGRPARRLRLRRSRPAPDQTGTPGTAAAAGCAARRGLGPGSRRARAGHLAGGGLTDVDISREDNPAYRWISPDEAGAVVARAIKRGDLYALTHPDWYGMPAAGVGGLGRQVHDLPALRRDQAAGNQSGVGGGGLL
jgi:hypothetical protein